MRNALGGVLLLGGLAPLIYEVVKAQPRTVHDWAFVAMVGLGAYLIDAPDVSAAIEKVKAFLPGKGA